MSDKPRNPNSFDRETESTDPESYNVKPSINTFMFMTKPDDIGDTNTDDSMGCAHHTDEVVGPQIEVRMPQRVMTSHDNSSLGT